MPEIIAAVSLILSLFALVQAIRTNRRQEVATTMLAHLPTIVELEARLGELPTALRFHGISPEELEEVGVTPQEFAYLVNSFTLGSVWHRIITPKIKTAYGVDHYRYRMCKSEALRKAWPLVKRMLNPYDFVDRIDETIAKIEHEQDMRPAAER